MIAQLTAIRGPLALWVVAYHFVGRPWAPATLGPLEPVVDRGYLGVDVFFLLSGLLIAHSWQRRPDRPVGRYLWSRLARIYPTHLVVMAAFAVLVGGFALAGRDLIGIYPAREGLLHLLLIDAWGLADGLTWNYPSWSISAEWFAYLVFPVSFVHLTRAPRVLTVLLSVAALGWLTSIGWDDPFALEAWTDGRSILRTVLTFGVGVAVARLVEPDSGGSLVRLGLGVVVFCVGFGAGLDGIVVTGAAVVLADLYARPSLPLPRWTLLLGRWSYALYLVHALVQVVVEQSLDGRELDQLAKVGVLVAAVTVAVAMAALLHHAVEQPGRRWVMDHPPRFRGPESSTRDTTPPQGPRTTTPVRR